MLLDYFEQQIILKCDTIKFFTLISDHWNFCDSETTGQHQGPSGYWSLCQSNLMKKLLAREDEKYDKQFKPK